LRILNQLSGCYPYLQHSGFRQARVVFGIGDAEIEIKG